MPSRTYSILNILYDNVRCKRARLPTHTQTDGYPIKVTQRERMAHERNPQPRGRHRHTRTKHCSIAKVWKITDKVPLLSYTSRFWLEILNFVCTFTLTLGRRWTPHTFLSNHCTFVADLSYICLRIARRSHRHDAMAFHFVSHHIYSCSATCDFCACAFIFRVTLRCAYIRFGNSYLALYFFFIAGACSVLCVCAVCAVDCNTTYTHIYHIRINLRIKYIRVHLKSTMQSIHWMCRYLFWDWEQRVESRGRGGDGEREREKSEADGNLHYFHDSMQLILVHKFIIARNVSAAHISTVCKIVKSLCIVWLLINTAYQFVIFFEW